MNTSNRYGSWPVQLRLRRFVLGVLICVPIQAFWSAGMREAHAEADTSDRPVFAEVKLSVKPTSCVALHRGQLCFQKLQLYWNNPEGHRLCLFSQDTKKPLYCTAIAAAKYRYEYQSAESEVFTLREAESGDVLAQVTVSTAWVYRTGKRSSSGWRLF